MRTCHNQPADSLLELTQRFKRGPASRSWSWVLQPRIYSIVRAW